MAHNPFRCAAQQDALQARVAVSGHDNQIYFTSAGQRCDFIEGFSITHKGPYYRILVRESVRESGDLPLSQFEGFQIVSNEQETFFPGKARRRLEDVNQS